MLLLSFSLLRQRPSDMFMEKQEELVRSTFKSFTYMECALLQQMIRNIAPVKMVSFAKYLCVFK